VFCCIRAVLPDRKSYLIEHVKRELLTQESAMGTCRIDENE